MMTSTRVVYSSAYHHMQSAVGVMQLCFLEYLAIADFETFDENTRVVFSSNSWMFILESAWYYTSSVMDK